MRNKKLLSTVVATTLVASTMAMPVMAADGGEVDVDVATKTAVIRVEVPTSLEVAVNQFEKADEGSQIFSAPFGIENKSEIPVKLTVDSTATLATSNPINLVATKKAAEDSTVSTGEAWVAVVAQTSDGKYIEGDGKGIKDLTEANENVTTFVQGTETAASTGTAQQVFYLGANATPTVTYKKLAPTTADLAAAKETAYAQIYEVTEITFSGTDDQTTLNGKLAVGNVYEEKTDNSITLYEKGKDATYTSTSKYYEIASSSTGVVASKDLAAGKIYMYGEALAGGKTGFRYIGKLSEGKETWTNADINKIKIQYDIKGVTTTKYGEVESNCTYGLYVPAPEVTTVTGTKIMNGSGKSTYSTSAALASRLQSGSVQFLFDNTTNDVSNLAVSKIVVDGVEYDTTKITVTQNTTANASSDGKLYQLTGFTATTADEVEVYYGNSIVVKYAFN